MLGTFDFVVSSTALSAHEHSLKAINAITQALTKRLKNKKYIFNLPKIFKSI